jgi:DNA-binding transcriptional LysR family regulator
MELGNTEAIKKLVGAGLGLSLGSCFAVRLVARLVHQRGIVLRKDKARTPALTAFLDALRGATRAPLT